MSIFGTREVLGWRGYNTGQVAARLHSAPYRGSDTVQVLQFELRRSLLLDSPTKQEVCSLAPPSGLSLASVANGERSC